MYRPTQRYAVLMAIQGLTGLVSIAVAAVLLYISFGRIIQKLEMAQRQGSTPNNLSLGVLAIIGFLSLIILGTGIIQAIMGFGQSLGTYLGITPDGIEYRLWPFYTLRCSWQDLTSIEKRKKTLGVQQDILYASRAETSGLGWKPLRPFKHIYGWKTDYIIALSTFEGWPKGDLANNLQQNAPHLFAQGDQ